VVTPRRLGHVLYTLKVLRPVYFSHWWDVASRVLLPGFGLDSGEETGPAMLYLDRSTFIIYF